MPASVLLVLAAAAATEFTVTVGPEMALPPVPRNFVGFSLEVWGAPVYMGPTGENAAFAQLLRNLRQTSVDIGSEFTSVRFGGGSTDTSCFEGGSAKCTYNVTMADMRAYATFANTTAKDLNIKYVVGVNFGLSTDPQDFALKHVQALAAANLWDHIASVEIGNEPDLYAGSMRPSSFTYAEFVQQYTDFISVLTAQGNVGRKNFVQGAAFCCPKGEWSANVPALAAAVNESLASYSVHNWPLSFCGGDEKQSVLGDDVAWKPFFVPSPGTTSSYQQYAEQLSAMNIPLQQGEGNSASCGGIPGVSDSFASTLWALDYLPYLSKAGAVGMSMHTVNNKSYAIAVMDGEKALVQPLYYGMLGFATLTANGAKWLAATVRPVVGDPRCAEGILAGGVCCAKGCGTCGGAGCEQRPGGAAACCAPQIEEANATCAVNQAPCVVAQGDDFPLDVHAVVDEVKNEVRVLVVSKYGSENRTANLCPGSSRPAAAASAVRIEAPSLRSKFGEGVTIGGLSFDGSTDGVLRGTPHAFPLAANATTHCFKLDMPPMSAAIVTFTM
ncbi:hypothetical protein DIPPA_30015 [Diplonema papillatum]|nr:hypothetical protein DIPPA_30015 [Diplonema papillatum]